MQTYVLLRMLMHGLRPEGLRPSTPRQGFDSPNPLISQENQFSRTLSGLPHGETLASSEGVWGNWFPRALEGLGYLATGAR